MSEQQMAETTLLPYLIRDDLGELNFAARRVTSDELDNDSFLLLQDWAQWGWLDELNHYDLALSPKDLEDEHRMPIASDDASTAELMALWADQLAYWAPSLEGPGHTESLALPFLIKDPERGALEVIRFVSPMDHQFLQLRQWEQQGWFVLAREHDNSLPDNERIEKSWLPVMGNTEATLKELTSAWEKAIPLIRSLVAGQQYTERVKARKQVYKESSERSHRQQFETEMQLWSERYGSWQLKQAISRGYTVRSLYAHERLNRELPGALLLTQSRKWRERVNPTVKALTSEERMLQILADREDTDVRIIFIEDDFSYKDLAGEEQIIDIEPEALLLSGYLGRYQVVVPLDLDLSQLQPLPPYLSRAYTMMRSFGLTDLLGKSELNEQQIERLLDVLLQSDLKDIYLQDGALIVKSPPQQPLTELLQLSEDSVAQLVEQMKRLGFEFERTLQYKKNRWRIHYDRRGFLMRRIPEPDEVSHALQAAIDSDASSVKRGKVMTILSPTYRQGLLEKIIYVARGLKVLIIDGDLLLAQTTKRYNALWGGIASVLNKLDREQQLDIAQLVWPLQQGVDLLTAPSADYGHELVSADDCQRILKAVRPHYDLIVVEAGAQMATEAVYGWASHADAVVCNSNQYQLTTAIVELLTEPRQNGASITDKSVQKDALWAVTEEEHPREFDALQHMAVDSFDETKQLLSNALQLEVASEERTNWQQRYNALRSQV